MNKTTYSAACAVYYRHGAVSSSTLSSNKLADLNKAVAAFVHEQSADRGVECVLVEPFRESFTRGLMPKGQAWVFRRITNCCLAVQGIDPALYRKVVMKSQKENLAWVSYTMACGTRRHELWVEGIKTPYFVDRASVRAHYTNGQRVGVFGAGMRPQGFALTLGSFNTVSAGKAHAIRCYKS